MDAFVHKEHPSTSFFLGKKWVEKKSHEKNAGRKRENCFNFKLCLLFLSFFTIFFEEKKIGEKVGKNFISFFSEQL